MKWILGFFLGLGACASADKNLNTYGSNSDKPLVDDKYTLGSDAKELSELRSKIPADKKRENDDMAFFLNLMREGKPPHEVRDKFLTAQRKKRESFDRDLSRERENFSKEERVNRELFLKTQAQNRERSNKEKHSREEKQEFSREQEAKRTDYFAAAREKRNDFEADVHERRKNFEDYAREKNNQFNEELRNYSQSFEEAKRQKRSQKAVVEQSPPANAAGISEAEQLEQDLQSARKKSGAPLESGQ